MPSLAATGVGALNRIMAPLGIRIVSGRRSPGRGPGPQSDLALYPEARKPAQPRYLNIGAGGWSHPYWHNLDWMSGWYEGRLKDNVDIYHDLMSGEPLPIDSASVDAVFTSHTIEHLRNEDVQLMFNEVHRCLVPGGTFRVQTPDMDLAYDAYKRGDIGFFYWQPLYTAETVGHRLLEFFASALTDPDAQTPKFSGVDIDRTFQEMPPKDAFEFFISQVPVETQRNSPGNHMNWFTSDKVENMLSLAGFPEVWKSGYLQSKCPLLRTDGVFDTTHPKMSLYMECRR